MWGRTYVICTLTLAYFCVSLVFNPVPNFTKPNPLVLHTRIILEIELFTAWSSFAVQFELKNLPDYHFYVS